MSKKLMFIVVLCIMAMAVTAYGADKLIVQNGSSVNVFKVTDGGVIALPATTGTNRDIGMQNPATVNNFGAMSFYPQTGTNVGAALQAVPRGTGYNTAIKAQLSLFNTDYIADSTNYETLVLRSTGTGGYSLNSSKGGTGLVRPILFQMNAVTKMWLDTTGNLYMGASTTGAYTDGASWLTGSSRDLKDNIHNLSAETANETLNELNPVTYAYKATPDQPRMGFIAEDMPASIAVKDRKHIDAVNIIAVLTKVVQDKSQVVEKQQKTIDALAAKLDKLETQLNKLQDKD